MISDGTALGGAFGVSAFYPENRPSNNCNVKAVVEYGGNFGLQFGNVDGGSMEVDSSNTMREVIGVEPYALKRFNFVQSDVSADTITLIGHGLSTGDALLYANLGNPSIAALNRPDYWFAIVITANSIKLSNSKELALIGQATSLAAFTGTHALLKCGMARDIKIKQSRVSCGDIAAAGSLTGLVVLTASSGGYLEGITIDSISAVERNPTSGSHGLAIFGAHNIMVNDFISIGSKQTGVFVDSATVNSITDATGNITPSPAINCRPVNVEINNPMVREFNAVGVRIRNGSAVVNSPYVASAITGAIGLQLEANATDLGSRMLNGTANVPNGTPMSLNNVSGKNRDTSDANLRDRDIVRIEKQSVFRTIVGAPNPVVTLSAQNAATVTYSGQLRILARSTTIDSSNQAFYILEIIIPNAGALPTVTQTFSSGLIAGAGASHPSFTWTVVANQLIATPIGSTSTTLPWNFYINSLGDIGLT